MFIARKRRQPPPMTNARMAVIFVIVGGCFLVLVPSIFFPITKTGFKYLFGMATHDYYDENNENFLPRKVEMVMKNSPRRDSGSTKKLSGRPQFYTGANMEKMYSKMGPLAPTTQMEQQIGVPTVIITFVVAYVMIKVLLNSSQEDTNNENINGESSNQTNCKCEQQPKQPDSIYKREAKRRDLIQSRPTYKAFDCYGDQVNESVSSLLRNMETFRDYLHKAHVCKCKLDKYKRIHQELLQQKNRNEKESVQSDHHSQANGENTEIVLDEDDKNSRENDLQELNDSMNEKHETNMNNQQNQGNDFEESLLTENNLEQQNIDDEVCPQKDADSILPECSNRSPEIDYNHYEDDAKENVEIVTKPSKKNARRRRFNKKNKTKLDCLAK